MGSIGAVVIVAIVGPPRIASADTETCARSYESAQTRRKEMKLLDAKRELLVCAQDSCPSTLRKDCVAWLAEVDAEIPAIAIHVQGRDGCDRPDAAILVDGTPIAHGADGRHVEVDPGSHAVRATIDNGIENEQVVVVSAGERRRVVTIAFGDRGVSCQAGSGSGSGSGSTTLPQQDIDTRKTPTLVYVLGGLGVLSLGFTAGFGISGFSQKGTLDDCKGACSQRDVDTMQRTFIIADVAGLIALASLGAAGILYFTR